MYVYSQADIKTQQYLVKLFNTWNNVFGTEVLQIIRRDLQLSGIHSSQTKAGLAPAQAHMGAPLQEILQHQHYQQPQYQNHGNQIVENSH